MIRCRNIWGFLLTGLVMLVFFSFRSAVCAETYLLEYTTEGAHEDFSLNFEEQDVRFKAEPAYAGSDVVRGTLSVSPDRKEYIAFASDLSAGKLYMDMNRNLDLTDDPDGVFSKGEESWRVSFTNIPLHIVQDDAERDYVIDLQIYSGRYGYYNVRSSWAGDDVILGGRKYSISVVDDGNGIIGFEDAIQLTSAVDEGHVTSVDNTFMKGTPLLVVNDEQYTLTYVLAKDGKTLEMLVEPGTQELHRVTLKGEDILELQLQGENATVVYFKPEKTVLVPEGLYSGSLLVAVRSGTNVGSFVAHSIPLTVEGGNNEMWDVGGPVVSKLNYRTFGNTLVFDQSLVGVGGEEYSPSYQSLDVDDAPSVCIKKDGQVLHVGKFEYG